MPDYPEPSLDARGRRKTSPAANEFYSRKILPVDDPDGSKEAEINRIAKRLCRARAVGAVSQELALKGKLVEKCMRFYYVVGDNVADYGDGIMHEGHYAHVDEIFMDALLYCVERYRAIKPFTHMLMNQFANLRVTSAYDAAREDSVYGGSKTSAPIYLDAPVRENDDKTTTVGDMVKTYDDAGYDEAASEKEEAQAEEDFRKIVDAVDALEKEDRLLDKEADEVLVRQNDDSIDDAILVKTLSLITGFLGKTGKAANDTRKLYTRMFFSETLTRVTKLRTEGELAPLTRQEKGLFGAVELPFQDTYTAERCRTIVQLWMVEFIDGIRPARRQITDKDDRVEYTFNYNWTLPGAVYIKYLKSLGMAASDQLVSQQRTKYEELLSALRAKS